MSIKIHTPLVPDFEEKYFSLKPKNTERLDNNYSMGKNNNNSNDNNNYNKNNDKNNDNN